MTKKSQVEIVYDGSSTDGLKITQEKLNVRYRVIAEKIMCRCKDNDHWTKCEMGKCPNPITFTDRPRITEYPHIEVNDIKSTHMHYLTLQGGEPNYQVEKRMATRLVLQIRNTYLSQIEAGIIKRFYVLHAEESLPRWPIKHRLVMAEIGKEIHSLFSSDKFYGKVVRIDYAPILKANVGDEKTTVENITGYYLTIHLIRELEDGYFNTNKEEEERPS